jgi:hypothetical protein
MASVAGLGDTPSSSRSRSHSCVAAAIKVKDKFR